MALYLGSDNKKQKVILNGVVYCLNLLSEIIITNGVRLLSSEGYVLKDSNGVYLTTKESDE